MTEREAFTARVLSALVTELADVKESAQRIEVSIVALAKEHGVKFWRIIDDSKGDEHNNEDGNTELSG